MLGLTASAGVLSLSFWCNGLSRFTVWCVQGCVCIYVCVCVCSVAQENDIFLSINSDFWMVAIFVTAHLQTVFHIYITYAHGYGIMFESQQLQIWQQWKLLGY